MTNHYLFYDIDLKQQTHFMTGLPQVSQLLGPTPRNALFNKKKKFIRIYKIVHKIIPRHSKLV